jgi:hypothetical protein
MKNRYPRISTAWGCVDQSMLRLLHPKPQPNSGIIARIENLASGSRRLLGQCLLRLGLRKRV